ncbi:MBL fold metallo-hydrolase [Actinotalea sp.]|uniref:MBL fold metallo-hydrolase n=1 Tax=Actinotalea sp. TaxID=1872145 RepID=UPI00356B0ECE
MRVALWVAAVVLLLIAVDRAMAHRAPHEGTRRRRRRRAGGGSGALGELITIFQPSARHLHDEAERKRNDLVTPGSPDRLWAVDLDAGTAIAASPEPGASHGTSSVPAEAASVPVPEHPCVLEAVAPGVWTIPAQPWSSLTTLLVADDGSCVVVDPNIWPADLARIVDEVAAHGWTPVAGFSTHPHWDHVLWPAAWAGLPRFATAEAAAEARARNRELCAEADEVAPGHDHRWTGVLTGLEAEALPWDGPRALLLPYAGHCRGSAALWLPGPAVLLSGDMLSDVEVPLLAEPSDEAPDPISAYRESLDLLAGVGARVLVPGHGSVADETGIRRRLAADRAYLDRLERAAGGADETPADAPDARLSDPEQSEHHARQLALVRSWREGG